jgi:hypothetical protein
MSRNGASERWCFTYNNYPENFEVLLQNMFDRGEVAYLIAGREVASTGTPHLQGFLCLRTRRVFNTVQRLLPNGCHIERARGSIESNIRYCSKDDENPFTLGEQPEVHQGKRSDIERFHEWCKKQTGAPSERVIMDEFPSLYLRYRGNLLKMSKELCGRPVLGEVEFRDWQEEVKMIVEGTPDDRHIHFYVDEDGNSGKSWLCKRLYRERPEKTQILRIGKRDDLALAIDESKSVFLFDIPRSSMQYLQYDVLEMLKDGMVFSPKYQSMMKMMKSQCHVMVFCNEMPDMEKLSQDRYVINEIN